MKEAAPIQIQPLTIKYSQEYLKEWSNLTAVKKTHSDDNFHYFTAREFIGDRIEVRVNRNGYIVDGTEYHDLWKQPIDGSADHWEHFDSIGLDVTAA